MQAAALLDYLAPAVMGLVFIVAMSRVPERVRLPLNAAAVIGASGVYMSGGFGLWEVAYAMLTGPVLGYWTLRSYYVIGVCWLLHATWDCLHHLYGHPIWPFMESSSLGCLIFDTVIGVWFLCGARSVLAPVQRAPAALAGVPRP